MRSQFDCSLERNIKNLPGCGRHAHNLDNVPFMGLVCNVTDDFILYDVVVVSNVPTLLMDRETGNIAVFAITCSQGF